MWVFYIFLKHYIDAYYIIRNSACKIVKPCWAHPLHHPLVTSLAAIMTCWLHHMSWNHMKWDPRPQDPDPLCEARLLTRHMRQIPDPRPTVWGGAQDPLHEAGPINAPPGDRLFGHYGVIAMGFIYI